MVLNQFGLLREERWAIFYAAGKKQVVKKMKIQGIGENSWNRGLEEEEVRNEIQSSGGN